MGNPHRSAMYMQSAECFPIKGVSWKGGIIPLSLTPDTPVILLGHFAQKPRPNGASPHLFDLIAQHPVETAGFKHVIGCSKPAGAPHQEQFWVESPSLFLYEHSRALKSHSKRHYTSLYRRQQPHFGPPGCGPVRQGASHRKPGWMQEECWPRYPTWARGTSELIGGAHTRNKV